MTVTLTEASKFLRGKFLRIESREEDERFKSAAKARFSRRSPSTRSAS